MPPEPQSGASKVDICKYLKHGVRSGNHQVQHRSCPPVPAALATPVKEIKRDVTAAHSRLHHHQRLKLRQAMQRMQKDVCQTQCRQPGMPRMFGAAVVNDARRMYGVAPADMQDGWIAEGPQVVDRRCR